MLQVSPETPLKYKRRKVSAIRQFPRGCIPNAAKLNPKPSEGTHSSVALENGKVTETDNVLADSNFSEKLVAPSPSFLEEKTLSIPGSSKDLVQELVDLSNSSPAPLENNSESTPETKSLDLQHAMESSTVLENNLESKPGTVKLEELPILEYSNPVRDEVEVQQVVMESSAPQILQNMNFYLKVHVPLKRRKISAIRQFPPGCGPNGGNIKKDNYGSVFAPPTSLNDKHLAKENIDEARRHLVGEGSVRIAGDEVPVGEMRRNGVKSVVHETDQGISSKPSIRSAIALPKSKILQQEISGDSTLVVPTKKILHGDENLPYVKQSKLIDGSTQMKNATMKQEKTIVGSVKAPSSEKIGAADRKDYRVTKEKELTIHESATVRYNSEKSSRIQGSSGYAQVKPASKSGLNEILVRSTSDKTLDVCKIGRTVQSSQTKANSSSQSSLVVKSQFGSKQLDKRGTPSMEKPTGKDNEIDQMSSRKRKLPEGSPYKGYSPSEGDDSLDAIGERMIIQALMSGKNCPWRNARKRTSVISNSVVPKSKIVEKRFKDKTPALKKSFSSQQKRKGLVEDDDDDDDDNLPQEKNQLSITMTPFVPPESSRKGGDTEEIVVRHKVKRALRLFQLICRKLLQGEESKTKRLGRNRIDLQASGMLKDSGEWVNSGDPIIGHVPGVEVGDEFHFRVELSIVGLHRPFQGGIDCTKKNGMLLATSIVASGGYQDDMDSSDVLIYSGSGGTSVVGGDKQQRDQKLERGNLALKNSIDKQTPVRVIHGFKEKGSESHDARAKIISTFTYDGLYHVESYWQEMGSHGFSVFKFQLRRLANQPELALKVLRRSAKLKNREGLCVKDISQGKEKIAISVVNTIDTDQPMPFKYITKSIYPSWYTKTPPQGCNCTNGCSDSDKCACAVKNGGEIPFNFNEAIVQAKPLIYECSPSCKCSSSCHNRVSQRGIKMQLEIFKTNGRGWGVRSLKSISSGTFICEYIGEMLQDGEAEQRTNDEYLFDIGHNYDDRSLWEGLPNLIPGLQSSSQCDTVESVGFTIDAAEYGNVGRFINHSCSPNLYAQNVLYDHDDKRMPHIMFFAVDNIPPLQELTYHYNYTIDEVRDSEGNIKQKACHCGSPECCGRLY
ncbi:Histone-lysine N-methyltransferase, H3 lysine-9 specific SUVH6 [Platanthera zijinensis]|uniref:Histone-lysine N-methyltransferase, H3 lysine-9 specific SUVH6 n=1 Tax=Platanthera zijinensis TaxID=2320716 RepID=A0AAP0BT02_9ASPA